MVNIDEEMKNVMMLQRNSTKHNKALQTAIVTEENWDNF